MKIQKEHLLDFRGERAENIRNRLWMFVEFKTTSREAPSPKPAQKLNST